MDKIVLAVVAIILTALGSAILYLNNLPARPFEIFIVYPEPLSVAKPIKITAKPTPKISESPALAPKLADNLTAIKPITPPQVFLDIKPINIQTIVLIRCLFRSQFYEVSSQPHNEENYNIGSGVVISPNGHILTARHLLDPSDSLNKNNLVGRVWDRKKCEVAFTDQNKTPIEVYKNNAFSPAEVIFKTSDDQYRDSAGLDFSVLKTESNPNQPYASLIPSLLNLSQNAPVVAVGYPGKIVAVPQNLERFDSELQTISFYEDSSCDGTIQPCGLRYFVRRYPNKYEINKSTEIGIITPFFRPGFSGAPAFFEGNLIGIVTQGIGYQSSKENWDEAAILTSYDIHEILKRQGLNF